MAFTRLLVRGKRYLKGAIFLYFIVFVCLLYWWTSNHGQLSLIRLGSGYRTPSRTQETSNKLIRDVSYNTVNQQSNASQDWIKLFSDEERLCNGKFVGYDHLFATLFQVSIRPDKGHGKRGGENITDVLNQSEQSEYFNLDSGYFTLNCSGTLSYAFIDDSHLNKWAETLLCRPYLGKPDVTVSSWTIAVMRYEYANLYHTMTDFFNVFLLVKYLQIDLNELNVLWLDGHPVGALDSTWRTLFGKVIRAGELETNTLFTRMAWNIRGYDSPLNHHDQPEVPLLEEFRNFFLSRHGVTVTYKQKCKNLRVLFIWRRDYLAHPRNPGGKVTRKIKNEEELFEAAGKVLPGHTVRGVQIDQLSMSKQLELIATTDILIGMHGAGLSHTLFLPQTSGLIEFYPTYWSPANRHFRAMAKWRNLHYLTWQNENHDREHENHYTTILISAFTNMLHEMHHKLCGDVHV